MDLELVFELLLMASWGGNRNRAEIVRRIGEMSPSERRCLRRAIKRLDSALDEAIIVERLDRLRLKRDETQPGED